MKLLIEIKEPGIEGEVVELVDKYDMLDEVFITSFFHKVLKKVKSRSPKLKCGVIFTCEPAELSRLALDVGAEALIPNYRYTTQELVEEAHENSLLVVPWTVNTSDEAYRLIDIGVDGVASDFPDVVLKLIKKR